MAVFNTKYYQMKEDTLYSDGDIEDEIYMRVCQHDKTLEMDPRWAVFYHFSPLRENILNWYPFDPDSSILEIGAGCGALTGLLLRRGKQVTACELTMRRAKILFQRYVEADNLEVIVGNVLRVPFETHFDYVIINGVLEYAAGIMGESAENPYVQFLKYVKALLKPDGKILLSIENRIGLKYVNGAPEDHVGRIFEGVNGYPGKNTVRTFSKAELSDLFAYSNLKVHHWFYPYPDYKFPTEIFSDITINEMEPRTPDIPYDMSRIELFDRESFRKTLLKNKVTSLFSNSFLIELAGVNKQGNRPDYIKISSNRKKKFAICTLIYKEEDVVEKRALYPDAREHLRRMETTSQESGSICMVPSTYQNGVLKYALLNQPSLGDVLKDLVEKGENDAFWDKIRRVKEYLYKGELSEQPVDLLFSEVFGAERAKKPLHWAQKVNIDLNVDNCFCVGEQWTAIDNEWVFDCSVAGEYALWRVLLQLRDYHVFRPLLTDEAIREVLEIGSEEQAVFKKWERHFSMEYVGMQEFLAQQKNIYYIDINEVLKGEEDKQCLWGQLFLFDEDENIEVLKSPAQNKDGIWRVEFSGKNICKAKQIRWDPLEGNACKISDIQIEGFEAKPINARTWDGNIATFSTYDPQFLLEGNISGKNCIPIQFKCEILDWNAGYYELECEKNEEKERRLDVEREYKAGKEKNQKLIKELETLKSQMAVTEHRLKAEQARAGDVCKKLEVMQEQMAIVEDRLKVERAQAEEACKKLISAQDRIADQETQIEIARQTILGNERELKEASHQLQQIYAIMERYKEEMSSHRLKSAAKIILNGKLQD